MRQANITRLGCAVAAGSLLGFTVRYAHAVPEFKKVFEERYIGEKTTDAQKSLDKAVAGAKCNVCHMGAGKKVKNAYGEGLSKLGLTKADKKKIDKINAVMGEAEKYKIDPKAKKTIGEQLKAGELPVK